MIKMFLLNHAITIRRSSASSNASHSEAESQTSTLTPQNASSGTEDEPGGGGGGGGGGGAATTKQQTPPRVRYNVVMSAGDSEDKECRDNNTFNFTVSLPRRSSITNAEDQPASGSGQRDQRPQAEDGGYERPPGDEEWSWETDGDCAAAGCGGCNLSPRTRIAFNSQRLFHFHLTLKVQLTSDQVTKQSERAKRMPIELCFWRSLDIHFPL